MPTFASQRGISLLMWEAARSGIFIYLLWNDSVVACRLSALDVLFDVPNDKDLLLKKKNQTHWKWRNLCTDCYLQPGSHILPHPPPPPYTPTPPHHHTHTHTHIAPAERRILPLSLPPSLSSASLIHSPPAVPLFLNQQVWIMQCDKILISWNYLGLLRLSGLISSAVGFGRPDFRLLKQKILHPDSFD